jgi:hypothetical protein
VWFLPYASLLRVKGGLWCLGAALAVAGLLQCSGASQAVSAEVTYHDSTYSRRAVPRGGVTLMPVLTAQNSAERLDTPGICFERLSVVLRSHCKAETIAVFRAHGPPLGAFRRDSIVQRFTSQLYKGEMIALKNNDSAWQYIDTDYLLVHRLVSGYNIRNVGTVHRGASLETELWHVASRRVVHRMHTRTRRHERYASFNRLVCDMAATACKKMPPFTQRSHTRNWLFFIFYTMFGVLL